MKKILIAIILVGMVAMPSQVAHGQTVTEQSNRVILQQLIVIYSQLIVLLQQQIQSGNVEPKSVEIIRTRVQEIQKTLPSAIQPVSSPAPVPAESTSTIFKAPCYNCGLAPTSA